MKGERPIPELIEELNKTRLILDKIDSFYNDFKQNEFPALGKRQVSAIVLAQVLADAYTCLETFFFRVSGHFENSLRSDRWHTELLHKMTLNIEGVRKSVISEKTHAILLELMRFRHFKRHYFQLEYDWDKLDFLEKKYHQMKPLLKQDLSEFENFLKTTKSA